MPRTWGSSWSWCLHTPRLGPLTISKLRPSHGNSYWPWPQHRRAVHCVLCWLRWRLAGWTALTPIPTQTSWVRGKVLTHAASSQESATLHSPRPDFTFLDGAASEPRTNRHSVLRASREMRSRCLRVLGTEQAHHHSWAPSPTALNTEELQGYLSTRTSRS